MTEINQPPEQETEQEQEQEQPDAIALLAERLSAIESALGVGSSKPNESNLLQRLNNIEQGIFKTERERNLPETITHSQLRNAAWMRKHGIQLQDIGSRIRIVSDPD
jgi:hypothetical protein